jgi:hypothetical protein
MKYIKMLGLAAIAAAALTALVGVGSASAVTLCEENVSTGCKVHVNSGGTIDFSAEDSVKLAGPFGITIDTCTVSTVQGTTGNTGADDTTTAVTGTVTTLTFTGCTHPTKAIKNGTLSVTASGTAGNGSVTSSGATVEISELPNLFGNPPICNYVTEKTSLGTLTASATASTFDIAATITSETANCPNGTWSGHYVSTGTVIKAVSH